MLNLTAEGAAIPGAVAALESALADLPAVGADAGSRDHAAVASSGEAGFGAAAGPEAYAISAQVGFAAAACGASRIGDGGLRRGVAARPSAEHGPALGGAPRKARRLRGLGLDRRARGRSLLLDLSRSSPGRRPRLFRRGPGAAEARYSPGGEGSESEVEEAAIGAIGKELRPMLPEERGFVDFRRSLYGIGDEQRQAKRDAMLAARGARGRGGRSPPRRLVPLGPGGLDFPRRGCTIHASRPYRHAGERTAPVRRRVHGR